MYYAVQKVLEKHNAVWSATPAFAATVTELGANIDALEAAVAKQVIDIRGYAISKAEAERQMVSLTIKVTGAAKAYAVVNQDQVLATQVNVTPSTFHRLRGAIVSQACQGLHDIVAPLTAELADYGITAEDLEALQTAIEAYTGLISSPRNAITARKGHTAEIGFLVRDTAKLLDKRMDALMGLFALEHVDFHREFFDARIIVDHRGSGDSGDIALQEEAA